MFYRKKLKENTIRYYKMPRNNIDYSKTIKYKIVCADLSIKDMYVGHTTEFVKLKNKHKYSCNTEAHHTHNYHVYKTIRTNGGWDNWTMIEVEKFPCRDGNEARTRERYWIEELKATLNMTIPNRTQEERYESNRETTLKSYKERYQRNREKILEEQKIYRNQEHVKERNKEYQETIERKNISKKKTKNTRRSIKRKKRLKTEIV
jgi:hypothetical protein